VAGLEVAVMCRIVFLMVLLLAGPAAVEQGTYIEQEVVIEAVKGQPAMQGVQKIWFTKDKIRNEMSYGDETSVAIIDLAADRIVLMPSEEKQYIQMKLADYQRAVSMRLSGSGLDDPDAKPRLNNTGEKKKIKDWECVKVVFEQGGKLPIKSELWVSGDTGIDFKAYLDLMKALGMKKMLGRLSEFVESIDGYPVQVRTAQTQHGQEVISTVRVTRIAIGPVDPALFKIPEGYKRIDESLSKE
jgi:hypothetical protein